MSTLSVFICSRQTQNRRQDPTQCLSCDPLIMICIVLDEDIFPMQVCLEIINSPVLMCSSRSCYHFYLVCVTLWSFSKSNSDTLFTSILTIQIHLRSELSKDRFFYLWHNIDQLIKMAGIGKNLDSRTWKFIAFRVWNLSFWIVNNDSLTTLLSYQWLLGIQTH